MDDNKPKLGRIRRAMYETGDGIRSLKHVAEIEEEVTIMGLAFDIEVAYNELRTYLDSKYTWD
jgi:hypothetical protein